MPSATWIRITIGAAAAVLLVFPRPDLARLGGEQLGLGARRMAGLPAAFAGLPAAAQQPVHRGA
jgi:hypothetical protein